MPFFALFEQFGGDLAEDGVLFGGGLAVHAAVLPAVGIGEVFQRLYLRFGQTVCGERPLVLHAAEGVHGDVEDAGDHAQGFKGRDHGVGFVFADCAVSYIQQFSQLLLCHFSLLSLCFDHHA